MPKEQLKTLTEQMYYVLLALKRERCGVDITEYVLLRTDSRLRLGPGTLYSMLSKFEDEQKQFDTVIHLVHLLIVMDDVDAVIDHLLHALDLLQHHLHSFFCDLIPLPPSFHPGLFDELLPYAGK